MLIYKATNIVNNKVYIGVTLYSLAKRRSKHYYSAEKRNSNLAFHRAIRKYGRESFEWKVIESSETKQDLFEREKFWISQFNSFGKNGYNMTIGGEGSFGHKIPKESIDKSLETKIKNNTVAKGSKVGTSKLSESDILKIKYLIIEGLPNQEIADIFNVSRVTISYIRLGKTWKHIGADVSHIPSVKRLSETDIITIKEMIKKGHTHKEIANKFKVNEATISNIKMNKIYFDIGEDVSNFNTSMNRNSILSENQVREIKILLKEKNLLQKEIAKMFNVSSQTINSINTNKIWKEVLI